ncbi:sugar ABC transporter permease [Haloarcula sp. S1AR25-5A]|uniref:Sugar ABC transporter permease n=1 Tax=Haloarcula terrestris TaxID=2950533 RepID=A0AAE4F0K8_9EURY|nr:sugar ABC transporter permease [Haloarcula terrestris]MDS0223613.1 sugar ABC transporter permease [Haloarcula terrestris]
MTEIQDKLVGKLTVDSRELDWRPYVYLLPAFVMVAIFLAYPLVDTFLLSFQEVITLGGETRWVGLDNYVAVVTDPLFWVAAKNTLIFSIGMIIVPLVLGLGLAMVINRGIKGQSFLRSLIFVPVVVPIVVAGIVFSWLLSPNGLVNWLLMTVGVIEEPARFLNSVNLSLPSVMLMVVWKRTGYYMVILLAGLQGLPDDVYEAAKIMGKSRWAMFRHITLPLLKPAILITLVLGIIDSVRAFAHVYVMTGGGPSNSSEILSTHFYQVAFGYFNFGKGAAYGFILFGMALVFSVIAIKLSGGTEI